MHALILAGGDGSRLAADGVTSPKALVRVGGVPQLTRLITACRRVGCETIACAVRTDLVPAVAPLASDADVVIVPVRTPTSLHSLEAGLAAVPAGPVFCVLVDTVMTDADWDAAHRAAATRLATVDAVVATTGYVRDDHPLWVDADGAGRVRAFGRPGVAPAVTGGMYWFGTRARAEVSPAVAEGTMRLRGFLGRLVDEGTEVVAIDVPRIIDVDTRVDLDEAIALMSGVRG